MVPSGPTPPPGPPRPWRLLARILLPGRAGADVRAEAEAAYRRDVERGLDARSARRRYRADVLRSAWSLALGHLRSLVSRGLLTDARLGFRMLVRQPMLTVVAMMALGLGIPATLATFHIFDVMYAPLPVPRGERVLGIREWDAVGSDPAHTSMADYRRWQAALRSFETVGAARSYPVNVHAGDPSAPPVKGAEITASGLALLRVRPVMGRLLDAADEVPGAPDVVLLREDLWRARFGADPGIVGSEVRIGRDRHTVVGILPADFRFPMDDQLWMPLRAAVDDPPDEPGPDLWVFGRLARGVTPEEADVEMTAVAARRPPDDPDRERATVGEAVEMPFLLMRSPEFLEGNPQWALVKVILATLLLVVCGNVGVLVLARTSTRTAEITVRTALGASRRRIVLQVFVETLVLALFSTGLGLAAAELVARRVMRLVSPVADHYWVDLTLTPGVVLMALGLAVLASVVAGVAPALRATGGRVHLNLQRAAAGRGTVRFGLGSSLLIVTEVVVAVGFLAAGGLLARKAYQDTGGELGLEPERYAVATVRLPDAMAREAEADDSVRALAGRLREEVLSGLLDEPGVVGAGLGISMPGSGGFPWPLLVEGDSSRPLEELPRASARRVHVDFFEGLGRDILAGRGFDGSDVEGEPGAEPTAVVVSSSFVEQALGGRQPLGRRIRYAIPSDSATADPHWYEIVGVVGAFGVNWLNPRVDAAIYLPLDAADVDPARYLVEVPGDPAGFLGRLRAIVAEVDPEATVTGAWPLKTAMDSEASLFRLASGLWLGLAAVAFLLSVSGLYALMAFTVSQRTREIGIRSALGAGAWAIAGTVTRRALAQLAVGLLFGAGFAWLLVRQFASDPELGPVNVPVTVAVTVACAALVGILACVSPTLRGLRIQPSEALRDS